jgi:hypothetical protein
MRYLMLPALLPLLMGCPSTEDPTEAGLPVVEVEEAEPGPSAEEEIAWRAKVKGQLETGIESKLGLRNRVEPTSPDQPVRIVFLDLPPRTVPRALPNGQIKQVLNPNGAPSRMKLLVRDVIEDLRLELAGFEMYNGKLHPENPTPFQ